MEAKQEIINKFGHPLTATELGRFFGEHFYLELPLLPKIYKLATREKTLGETVAKVVNKLPKAPEVKVAEELPIAPDQKIILPENAPASLERKPNKF